LCPTQAVGQWISPQEDYQMANAGLIDLLGGAVTDREFRTQLLHNPRSVLATFDLTVEERDAITSIRAVSFEDFAAQLYGWMVGQGNGYGTVRGHERVRLSDFRPVPAFAAAGTFPV
jgi:hypothetical protein